MILFTRLHCKRGLPLLFWSWQGAPVNVGPEDGGNGGKGGYGVGRGGGSERE